MTKCNWKFNIVLLLSIVFAVIPCHAKAAEPKPSSGFAGTIITEEQKKYVDAEIARVTPIELAARKTTQEAYKKFSDKYDEYKGFLGFRRDFWYNGPLHFLRKLSPFHDNSMKTYIAHFKEKSAKARAEGEFEDAVQLQELIDLADEYVKEWNAWDLHSKVLSDYNSIKKNGDNVYIYTDEKTNTVLFYIKDGDSYETVAGTTKGCIPLPAKIAESINCIFCPLFNTIFTAAQSMTTLSYAALARAIANVLLIGLAIWIAFSVMIKVSSFTKMDTPKFITELLTQIFKVMVAYLLLVNASFVYDTVIGPLLKAGMEFGMSLLFEEGNKMLNECESGSLDAKSGLLPGYLYTQLECFIMGIQKELSLPQSIGSTLMCISRHEASTDMGAFSVITTVRMPDFSMMFQGLIIWVFAWLVSLAFAFYLIDAVVRLGIIGALMPFLIASWPFKVTSKYTAQGWSMFMNTFFTFVFMGLVVSVNVQLMGHALTGGKGGLEEIQAAINGTNVKTLQALLDIGVSGFLVLIACCIFGFKLTAQATELAGSMAGGGGSSPIGSNIGGLAASGAKAGVLGTGKATWGATKIVGNATGVTPKLRQAKDATKKWIGSKLGFGSSSGVAGGKSLSTTSNRPVTPTSQTQPNPNTPFSINGSQQQADAVQNADPRNQNTPITPTNSEHKPTPTHNEQTPPQTPEQLKQELENDYNNTANGKAGQQMILNQAAEVTRNKKTENEAQNKMNYHNKRADEYLKKAEKAPDPVQKKQFEDLANAQFAEAVKAEAEYNKAKAETLKSEAELQAVKQENERYKNQYVQDEMKKRNPAK